MRSRRRRRSWIGTIEKHYIERDDEGLTSDTQYRKNELETANDFKK